MKYIIDRFRAWNRNRINLRRLLKPPQKTPLGFSMKGPPYIFDDTWEVHEIKLLRKLLSRSQRFINVGANVGIYVLLARQLGLSVTAIEPVPQTVQFLLENLELNLLSDHVTVIPAAAGNVAGVAKIYGVGTGASLLKTWGNNPETSSQRVPVICLDDVISMPKEKEQLLILVDVEGFEYQALLGAKNLMAARPRPIWIVEMITENMGTAKNCSAADSFSLFINFGYSAKCINPTMRHTNNPIQGVSNYVFFDQDLDIDSII